MKNSISITPREMLRELRQLIIDGVDPDAPICISKLSNGEFQGWGRLTKVDWVWAHPQDESEQKLLHLFVEDE